VPRGLEDEAAIDHPGNTVVKTLTLSLDSWETHGFRTIYTTKYKNVSIISAAIDYLFDLSLRSLETSYTGILAAGDVRSGSVKRCAAAVGGDGMAVEGCARGPQDLRP
jgi:hypothetical protein